MLQALHVKAEVCSAFIKKIKLFISLRFGRRLVFKIKTSCQVGSVNNPLSRNAALHPETASSYILLPDCPTVNKMELY